MSNVTEIKRAEEQLDWVGGDEVVSLPEPTAPTAPRIATLSSSAVLVTLGLGEWRMIKKDKLINNCMAFTKKGLIALF